MSLEERQRIEDCYEAIDVMRNEIMSILHTGAIEGVDLDEDDAVNKYLEKYEYLSKWLVAWVGKRTDKFTFNYDADEKEFIIKFTTDRKEN